LWVWLLNVFIWQLVLNFETQRSNARRIRVLSNIVALVAIPYAVSLLLYYTTEVHRADAVGRKEIVVVQPNIDPYNTKFDPSTLDAQLQTLLNLSRRQIDSNTHYLVWPETAIPEGVFEDKFDTDESIATVRAFLKDYPQLQLVTGISGYLRYANETMASPTARKLSDGSLYDAFNTGLQFGATGPFQVYHKSKLVPGAEQLPYPEVFKFVEKYALDFGGTTGSLGKQDHRSVFYSPDDSTGIAPVICYESVYGEYCNEYVQRGAEMIFIITNDGWWGNSPGHVQHLYYGTLRAIETRRPIARSANTGISCFIDIKGDIYQAQAYETGASIKSFLQPMRGLTFYVRFGDYIGRMAIGTTIVFVVMLLIRRFRRKTKVINQPVETEQT
ncbi:MAG TPA: apolipoprotein N-acyltransferase, partial [Chitinophagales bacterium]|nr:apolipoprotein N-acyltransferase [Chitinophagales bacterium]